MSCEQDWYWGHLLLWLLVGMGLLVLAGRGCAWVLAQRAG